MSLFTYTTKSYTSPRFWVDGPVLHAQTAFLIRLLCLFFYFRQVAVDREAQTIEITTRWFWGLLPTKTTIPFTRIQSIETNCTSWISNRGLGGPTNEFEIHGIVLRLMYPFEKVMLIEFSGDGSVQTGLKDVLVGDNIVDRHGDQDGLFRDYYDLLKQFTKR